MVASQGLNCIDSLLGIQAQGRKWRENKTKYFRLRLNDEGYRDLRPTGDRPEILKDEDWDL